MIERGMNFFNEIAQRWDAIRCTEPDKIAMLVNMVGIQSGSNVLDVGCGTGVLLPYLKTAVGESGTITAIDFAVNMIAKAAENNKHLTGIEYLAEDIQEFMPGMMFDAIVCLNFFPHVAHKEEFIAKMKTLLKPDGILVIMHDISRQAVNSIHQTSEVVKNDRLPECSVVKRMIAGPGLDVVAAYENDKLYFVKAIRVI